VQGGTMGVTRSTTTLARVLGPGWAGAIFHYLGRDWPFLGGALVMEALRPYWGADRSPHDAHEALRRDDPELARVIEAIAPMLLGRVEAQEEGRAAIEAVEALLGG